MKNWFEKGGALATYGLCLAVVACSNASAKTTTLQDAQRATAAKTNFKAMTDDERRNFVRSLAPRLSRSTKGVTPRRTRAGTHHIDTQGQLSHMVVATQGLDGKVQQSCVSTPEELNQLLIEKQERDRRLSGGQP